MILSWSETFEIEGSDAVGNILLNVGVLSPQADASVLIIHFDTMIHKFARSEVFIFGQKAYRGRLDEGGYMTMHLRHHFVLDLPERHFI